MVVPVRPTVSVSGIGFTTADLASSAYAEPFTPSAVAGYAFEFHTDAGLFTTSAGSTAASADNDPIGRWEDQSVNARHLTQASSTKRPVLKTGVLPSGKAVVRGDGVDDILKTAAFTLDQPTHLFLVVRQVSWTNGEYITDGATNITLALRQATTTPRVEMSAGSAGPATTSLALGTAFVVSMLFDGASSELRVNGGAAITGNPGTASAGGLTVFGRASDVLWANADIGYVVGYTSAVTGDDLTDLTAYLKEWSGVA